MICNIFSILEDRTIAAVDYKWTAKTRLNHAYIYFLSGRIVFWFNVVFFSQFFSSKFWHTLVLNYIWSLVSFFFAAVQHRIECVCVCRLKWKDVNLIKISCSQSYYVTWCVPFFPLFTTKKNFFPEASARVHFFSHFHSYKMPLKVYTRPVKNRKTDYPLFLH